MVGHLVVGSTFRSMISLFPEQLHCSIETPLECQKSCKRTLTFYLTTGGGFGSEYVHVVLAFTYAALKQRQFRINSTFWNYGDFADLFIEPLQSSKHCRPLADHEMEPLTELLVTDDHNASHLLFSRFQVSSPGGMGEEDTQPFICLVHMRLFLSICIYRKQEVFFMKTAVVCLWKCPCICGSVCTVSQI